MYFINVRFRAEMIPLDNLNILKRFFIFYFTK